MLADANQMIGSRLTGAALYGLRQEDSFAPFPRLQTKHSKGAYPIFMAADWLRQLTIARMSRRLTKEGSRGLFALRERVAVFKALQERATVLNPKPNAGLIGVGKSVYANSLHFDSQQV